MILCLLLRDSLYENSMNLAICALDKITEGNRPIGIILHISELKEITDKQIIVKKDKSGGGRVKIVPA